MRAMLRPFPILALGAGLIGLPLTLAKPVKVSVALEPSNCLFGCFDALSSNVYADVAPEAAYYAGFCASHIFKTSIASCTKAYCSTYEQELGWDKLVEYCALYGDYALEGLDEVLASINTTVGEYDTIGNPVDMINQTIIPIEADFVAGRRTEDAWNREMNFHHAFGWSMYLLFGFAVLYAMGERVYETIHDRLALKGVAGVEDAHRPLSLSKTSTWWRKHVSVPALFGKRHAEPWAVCSLPTRLQAIVIFIYVAINLIFSFVGYDLFDGNLYWADKESQYARYIADRTGIMSFYNLPLLWCLAGRNDVFLWLTGWSYSTASMFHRWVAWVATVQAIAHSAAYTWIERDALAIEWEEEYWRTGIWATIVMSLLLVLSIRPIREKCYEVFLIVHIGLALACIVLLFYHVKIFDGEYDAWLWACVACWVLDRFLRIARMITLSFRTFVPGASARNTKAILAYKSSGLMRLTVTPSIPIKPQPGHYYYLYSPWSLTPWENHPFTLGSWNASPSGDGSVELHFLVGPQAGATRRLQRRIERTERQHPGLDVTAGDGFKAMDMRMYLEGPYGQSHNLAAYDHVLLIAGGSGVTAILPYVHALQAKAHVQVTVVWSVTSRDYAADVLSKELAGVEVQLYITRADADAGAALPQVQKEAAPVLASSGNSEAGLSDDGMVTPSSPATSLSDESGSGNDKLEALGKAQEGQGVTIHERRADMSVLVNEAVDGLVGGDRLAILTCGPGGMMDDLRAAVVKAYDRVPASQLTYYEDSFGW